MLKYNASNNTFIYIDNFNLQLKNIFRNNYFNGNGTVFKFELCCI